ncbi:MAG: hypothetical protein V3U52_01900 [Thermoplasmata archaeon]
MDAKRLSPKGNGMQVGIKASPAELVNATVSLGRDHFEKLLILVTLRKKDSPREFLEGLIDDSWEDLDGLVESSKLRLDDLRWIATLLTRGK